MTSWCRSPPLEPSQELDAFECIAALAAEPTGKVLTFQRAELAEARCCWQRASQPLRQHRDRGAVRSW